MISEDELDAMGYVESGLSDSELAAYARTDIPRLVAALREERADKERAVDCHAIEARRAETYKSQFINESQINKELRAEVERLLVALAEREEGRA